MKSLACVLFLVVGATSQYLSQQAPQLQYRQPQYYSTAGAQTQAQVFEQGTASQQPQVFYARPAQPQPLLGNVDRQVQKVAQHLAGPTYAHQIQAIQLQGQAAQAQAQVQRNAIRLASVPRAQPLQYQRALQQGQGGHSRQADEGELQQEYDSNPSYQFGFDVKDDLYTNYQNRKEQREGDKITGSYSVVDSDGFIRTVTYTADPKQGFKAEVTRQPTDIVVKVPQPQPQHQQQQQQYSEAQQSRQQPQYYEAPIAQVAQAGRGAQKQSPYIYQYQ